MNFREIRLAGFKSFADRTSIRFDDGVTCIVGPNGCGKSNVADAVRWVLGEQSAKTLRGSSMQDVIFGGTEARRPLSVCEVTLVFDNSARIFDTDYTEVAMTRRLYRSGESEYLLNERPCRLKDITNLLHGVGIGKEGYSIIGQGKVTQIMNSKPVERRAIFEEATGVIQFRSQKGEIERKLESARENLTVYIQRMDEAEKQLLPLEKQAQAAKKYRELNDQLKYEEVNAYLIRTDTFEAETARYRTRMEEAETEIRELGDRLSALDAEEESSRQALLDDDSRLRIINEKLLTFEVGIERKSGEAKVMRERVQSLERQQMQAGDEIDAAKERTREIDRSVEEGVKNIEAAKERAKELEKEIGTASLKLTEADTRLAVYERISSEKRASELSSVENLADVRAGAGSLSAKRDLTQDRIGEVKDAIEKAKLRNEEYTRQLNECRKEKGVCTEFLDKKPDAERDLLDEVADLKRSEQKISEEINDCNNSIINLNNNLEMYIGLKSRFDGYRDSVRNLQLDAKKNPEIKKRIAGAIADIISTEKKYEVAIETAFGANMQNLVTENADDARWLIEYLKRTGGGIVTFLPVEGMRPRADSQEIRLALRENGAVGLANDLVKYNSYYENVIKNLLGNTLICDTIASATAISKKYPRAFRIVTLDGDNIATSGAMTGGSRRKESGNLLAGERNIKECEEAIARKKATLEKLKKALASCSRELEEARERYEQFRVKVQEVMANFAALSQKELALAGLIADTQANLDEYNALLSRLTRQADELEDEANTFAQNEDLLNKIRAEAAQEAEAQSVQVEELRAKRDKIAEQLHDLRVESVRTNSGIETEEETILRLRSEKEELAEKIEETEAQIKDMAVRLEELKAEEERVSLSDEERQTVAKLRLEQKQVEEHKTLVTERQQHIAVEKRSLFDKQTEASERKSSASGEIARAQASLESMRQKIEEGYGLTYESAQALRDPLYDIAQSNTNIVSLRHKIAALGPVNQRAEEDYDTLLARYNEMKTQKEDIDKGILDLSEVLQELRDTIQKQFDDGFNRINANFTQIFKELFGGGKAEMQLDYEDCDDPLDAGVEIVACPPGKKLAKISLLSGGEQAFTAIAILFAILKTHPMPFCILDEIEAALDEANVDRFAKYLKKFSRETQFIVISHKKPTMVQADTLLGVTMEEKGVSKIVSVKLSEVEERLGGDTVA